MKTYKELKTNIYEAGEGSDTPDGGDHARPSDPDFAGNLPYAMYQLEKPGVLEQINGFVKALSQKEYIEPRGAVIELRTKLNVIGLDFVFNALSVSEGKYEYPLTANGGRWGWDMDAGDIVDDDGITHRLGHGLVLRCEAIQTDAGLWRLDCEVVPTQNEGTNEGAETDIAREKEKQAASQDKIRELQKSLKRQKKRDRTEN